jgi:hypothetical protein
MKLLWAWSSCICILLALAGCQHDSDYALGTYAVTVTVQRSSCPAALIAPFEQAILPASVAAGHSTLYHWTLRRIGITGDGAERLKLSIRRPDRPEQTLTLRGTLHERVLRVETQCNLIEAQDERYRFVLIHGWLGPEALWGEMRLLLSHVREAAADAGPPYVSPAAPCEVYTTFSGTSQ